MHFTYNSATYAKLCHKTKHNLYKTRSLINGLGWIGKRVKINPSITILCINHNPRLEPWEQKQWPSWWASGRSSQLQVTSQCSRWRRFSWPPLLPRLLWPVVGQQMPELLGWSQRTCGQWEISKQMSRRQLKFFGYVMRRNKLMNLITSGKFWWWKGKRKSYW